MSKHMSKSQMKKKEEISKAMKRKKTKEYMEKKYGKRADEVRSRTATKMAQKNESVNPYKERLYSLLENDQSKSSFRKDIIDAIRAHVDNPHKTISSERGDDFDIMDHAGLAAEYIDSHMKDPKRHEADSREIDRHEKRIKYLKRVLSDNVVNELMKKHFG